MTSPSNLNTSQQAALAYVRAGLSVLPTGKDKIPVIKSWEARKETIPTEEIVVDEFKNGNCIGIVGGKVSGNGECIDFDFEGKIFTEWMNLADAEAPGLIEKLVIQETQSGGFHVVYRCAEQVGSSQKLARDCVEVPGPGKHEYEGKEINAIERGGKYFLNPCLIETRGEGSYFLAYPSAGYTIQQGKFSQIPTITAEERNILISAAMALNKWIPEPRHKPGPAKRTHDGLSPGDDYNMRGDIPALLQKHGWTPTGRHCQNREHWRRPGKSREWSATLFSSNNLYVFSSNAPPFEAEQSYSPLAIYTLLEHGGDYTAAVRELARQGYGESREQPAASSTEKPNAEPKQGNEKPYCIIEGMDAATLMGLEFPEPKWIIPGILPEGTFLFGGKPKAGKSVLALNLCLAVASGGKFLGQDIERANVLYLHLEDPHRRIQRRLNQMLPIDAYSGNQMTAPANLHLYNKWPKIGEGGLRALDDFISKHKIKLVVIDTFKRFHADITRKDQKKSQYEIDYERLIPITEIAERHTTNIGAIVHNRKMESEDPMDLISGTLGNTGAVDTICVFYNRKGARAQLFTQGRDVEAEDYTLEYVPDIWTWTMLGKTAGVMANDSQQAVIAYIREYHSKTNPATLTDIVSGSGVKKSTISNRTLPALLKSATVIKDGYNKYYAIGDPIGIE